MSDILIFDLKFSQKWKKSDVKLFILAVQFELYILNLLTALTVLPALCYLAIFPQIGQFSV